MSNKLHLIFGIGVIALGVVLAFRLWPEDMWFRMCSVFLALCGLGIIVTSVVLIHRDKMQNRSKHKISR